MSRSPRPDPTPARRPLGAAPPRRRRARAVAVAASGVVLAGLLAACGGGSSGGTDTITVSYRLFGENEVQKNFLESVKEQFEAENQGVTVDLQPINASEDDYFTKLQLQMRSPRTSPDVVYEDTFQINSDIEAGYLRPLDEQLAAWDDWDQFQETAKTAAQALDGKTYGVPDGTDTRALWYNKEIFDQAGLPTTWEPESWEDILAAARQIKERVPDVTPINVYAGTGVGEAASMQGFEMLLHGTQDRLYDDEQQKWVAGSQGFRDALQFIRTLREEDLSPSPQDQLKPTWGNTVQEDELPAGRMAIALDGSWVSRTWSEGGASVWPEWQQTMGTAAMPTQNGQGPGRISMSGGWTWAIPENSDNPEGAWELIQLLGNQENQLAWATNNVQIPVRTDVAEDPTYLEANPTNEFFASLVADTEYRPAYSVYPRVSQEIQAAMEAVVTDRASVDEAAERYDQQLEGIAGDDVVSASGS